MLRKFQLCIAGWDYQAAIQAARDGLVAAVVADDTILVPEANKAADCELHIVQEDIEEYDLALAFRRTFNDTLLIDSVNLALLYLLQNGTLEVCSAAKTLHTCVHKHGVHRTCQP